MLPEPADERVARVIGVDRPQLRLHRRGSLHLHLIVRLVGVAREPDDGVRVDEAGGHDAGTELPVPFGNLDVRRSADTLDLPVFADDYYAIRDRGAAHGLHAVGV